MFIVYLKFPAVCFTTCLWDVDYSHICALHDGGLAVTDALYMGVLQCELSLVLLQLGGHQHD